MLDGRPRAGAVADTSGGECEDIGSARLKRLRLLCGAKSVQLTDKRLYDACRAHKWSREVARWFRLRYIRVSGFPRRWLSTASHAPSPLPARQTGRAHLRHPASGSESGFRNQEPAFDLVQGE